MAVKVKSVRHIAEYVLEVGFTDGSVGPIDFRGWLTGRGGLLAAFDDVEFFRQVRLDEESGTLCWPNGVDLCPDVLRNRATGASLPGAERPRGAHAA